MSEKGGEQNPAAAAAAAARDEALAADIERVLVVRLVPAWL